MFQTFRRGIRYPFGRPRYGQVYFIQRGDDGPIKIGFSHDPKQRLRTLQTAHTDELHLLLTKAGSTIDERNIHNRFRKHHLSGEWFKPHDDILSYIQKERQI